MSGGGSGFRWVVAFLSLAALPDRAPAQIKIIPQQSVREAAESTTIGESDMLLPDGDTLDFGTLDELGGAWQGEIEWRNRGDKPIVVTRINTTCGCLQVVAAESVVQGGATSRFRLTYHPKGHPGSVRQRAFVYTNLSEKSPTAVLHITGEVTASADRSGDYSYRRGALLLRQERVTFAYGVTEVARIACMNGGTTPLEIGAEPHFTPQGISLHTEPRRLEAGAEGDLIIEYDPRTMPREGVVKVMLEGLQLPPRERTIEILIDKNEK